MLNNLFRRERADEVASDFEAAYPPMSLADMIDTANWWTRLSDPGLFRAAATRIRHLVTMNNAETVRLNALSVENNRLRSIAEAERKEAGDLVARARHAIDEMSKNAYRTGEEPVAIVFSPAQIGKMTFHGVMRPFGRHMRDDLPALPTLHGIPVYKARGVYGPVVMTQVAFDAFSRQAPELILTAA